MNTLTYNWRDGTTEHAVQFVRVPGTRDTPFLFGAGALRRAINVRDFLISTTPVTQALWHHVMGSNPAVRADINCPIENVSWDHINERDGFLDRINSNGIRDALTDGDTTLAFRLPSESEWEYAARGGPRWTDGFRFSGSNEPDDVAWYGPRFTRWRQITCEVLGWRIGWRLLGRFPVLRVPTRTHDVATKAPNQLGIYDMSGNVWEWCQDTCDAEVSMVPSDGTPWIGSSNERRLRGGCHHNWDLHCTVSWRYGIQQDAHDGCIGFRLVLAPNVAQR